MLAEPLSVKNCLVVAFETGEVVCLESKNGKMVWKKKIRSGQIKGMNTDGRRLILCSSNGWVKSLDLQTAKEHWHLDLDYYIGWPPVLEGDTVIVAAKDHIVHIDLDRGEKTDEIPVGKDICTGMAVSDGFICFGTKDGKLHYRGIAEEKDLWTYRSRDAITSIPLMTDRLVIVVDHSGYLSAILR